MGFSFWDAISGPVNLRKHGSGRQRRTIPQTADTVGQPCQRGRGHLAGEAVDWPEQDCVLSACSETTFIIFVVENNSEVLAPTPRILLRRLSGISDRRGVFRHAAGGASTIKRDVRVLARGRSLSQATIRSTFIAAAVATCWTWVFVSPRYLYRSPKPRTPWERVPSTPARRLQRSCPSAPIPRPCRL